MDKKEKKIESVAFICDGNRRWGKENNLSKQKSYNKGADNVFNLIKYAEQEKIKNVCFYLLSTENLKRSKTELNFLINLFKKKIKELSDKKKQDFNPKISFVGDMSFFTKDTRDLFLDIEKKTIDNKSINVFFAISYGGRMEIIEAVKKISKTETKKQIQMLTEKKFEQYLWTQKMKDPEIIIRTGGDKRLSNFLLWRSSYSEIYFTKTKWPDFSKREFKKILKEYILNARINNGK